MNINVKELGAEAIAKIKQELAEHKKGRKAIGEAEQRRDAKLATTAPAAARAHIGQR